MSKLIGGNEIDLGKFDYEPGLVKDFEISFTDLSDFHYVSLGCGSCTDILSVDKETGKIKGALNIEQAIGTLKNTAGEHPITKYLSVKFNPEVHEFVADSRGKRLYNSNAEIYNLSVKFLVRVQPS